MGKFNYTTNITGRRSISTRRAIYRRSSSKDCCYRTHYKMQRLVDKTLSPITIIEPISVGSKPKILCLHGGGQSVSSFRYQLLDLMNALPEFEFVFAKTPEDKNVWIRDPPGGKGEPTTESDWAIKSHLYLDNIVSQEGPFYAILGFSQGVAMILSYLAYLQENNSKLYFDKVILLNGYMPTTHRSITSLINKLNTSTFMLKVVGEKDEFYELGTKLYNELKLENKNLNLEIYKDTALWHFPVMKGYLSFNKVVEFILK